MLAALCPALDDWVVAPPERVHEAFAERDALQRPRDLVERAPATVPARAAGIDERGNLLVELASGEEKCARLG